MKQEEIVYEIRRMCGNAKFMPSLGWHFRYNGQVYFYVVGKDEGLLNEAVNDANRNVKFIKALFSDRDEIKVSLDYDHKITEKESAKDIVPHIITALNFAVGYLGERVREKR